MGLVVKQRCEVRNWRCATRNTQTLVTIDPGDFKGNDEGPGERDDEGAKTRRARRRQDERGEDNSEDERYEQDLLAK